MRSIPSVLKYLKPPALNSVRENELGDFLMSHWI